MHTATHKRLLKLVYIMKKRLLNLANIPFQKKTIKTNIHMNAKKR